MNIRYPIYEGVYRILTRHRPLPSLGDGGIVGAGEARADARR